MENLCGMFLAKSRGRSRLPLVDGEHSLKWTYQKDENLSDGLDRAWLDYIRVEPSRKPLLIKSQENQFQLYKAKIDLQHEASGQGPLTYQWFLKEFQSKELRCHHCRLMPQRRLMKVPTTSRFPWATKK